MQQSRSTAQEAAQDIFFGQIVMNWARWFVIGAAAILILGTADRTQDLVLGIWPVVGLMALNFYLHGRRLAERPANPKLTTLASVLDVTVITVVVLTGLGAGLGDGLQSPFFVAYYPVVLAFAFVMPPRTTVIYSLAVLAAYAGACLLADGTAVLASSTALETLVARLIALAAVAGLGTYFWRIQRQRRRAAVGTTPSVTDYLPGS